MSRWAGFAPYEDVRRLVCVAGSVSLTALVLLLHGSGVRPGAALVTFAGGPAVHDVAAQRREMQGHEMRGRDVVSCFDRLSIADEPLFAVYGDSLTRGVFFDVATLLNSSSTGVGSDVVHPGHGANYSDDCTIFETRPPLRRLKCGGFEYAAPLTQDDLHRTGRVVTPERLAGAGLGRMRQLRMTYRLKTFTWEEEFDTPWLESLRHAPRLPDVLLLGFGVWDMQYPPGGDVVAGIEVLLLRALQTRAVRVLSVIAACMRAGIQSLVAPLPLGAGVDAAKPGSEARASLPPLRPALVRLLA